MELFDSHAHYNDEKFDEDREKIKQNGVELAKGTIDRIYEDNFNIYKAFTTAEEKLHLFVLDIV